MTQEVGPDMVIDRVDDSDAPIGTIVREQVFSQRANFRVVHVFVFNTRGELLLQQIPTHRERHPGRWGSSVAGYVFAGESYVAAAERRVREELGIVQKKLHYVGKTTMLDGPSHKFITIFSMVHDGPFNPDRNHIASLQFQPVQRVWRSILQQPEIYTPTFLHVFRYST